LATKKIVKKASSRESRQHKADNGESEREKALHSFAECKVQQASKKR
jgi:hypothetical protein